MLKCIACLIAVATFALGPAVAGAKGNKPRLTPEERFQKLDKDANGMLSLAEFVGKAKGANLEKREAVFKAKDANNDGMLTLDEFKSKVKKNKK